MKALIKIILNFNLYTLLRIFKVNIIYSTIKNKYFKNDRSEYTRILLNKNINDIFDCIGIETIALCNRGKTSCASYCPVDNIKRKNSYMKEEVYYKIVNELSSMKFSGSIRPYYYSEPLLDKRLVKFVKHARINCPNAQILIKSNGDYLDFEKYMELKIAGVTRYKITQYDGYFQKNIVDIFLQLDKNERDNFEVRIVKDFYENRGMYEREEVENGWIINEVCNFPLEQMFITSDGNAVLCPNDFDGDEIKLGNVMDNKLIDIWQSSNYLEIRKEMQKGMRSVCGDLCVGCNHTVDLHGSTKYVHLN
tara:strand:- start:278 stop:1198 length:921 start_codon:yes stop_codon:yes gene_type:complete